MKTIKLLLLAVVLFVLSFKAAAQVDFREETIYFLMTTRFFDGDPTNNVPNEWCSYNGGLNEVTDPNDVTWRGDFKGLIQKLDYIKDLGFTAIWITPVVQNAGPLDYHGYHAWDFTKVDARLESPGATFQDLIDEVHARDMKIVLDVVTNHSGRYGIKGVAELKYNTDTSKSWGQDKNGDPLQPNSNWEFNGITPNPDDGKIWSRANLAPMPAPYNEHLDRYNWPSTESFVSTSDPNWFHHSGNGFAQGWDDTENLYNRALAGDTPDLNTSSQDVRDYLVAAYTTFINMGVDAFRWDTMKHQSKEDVMYFYDAFKAVNPDLFIFGETAQKRHELHNVEEINPHWYTWRGAVGNSEPLGIAQLDFYAEATFHNIFEEGGGFSGVHAAARYDHLYSDSSTNLLWLDNHDFGPNNDWNRRYGGSAENLAAAMNFMFTWRGIPVIYYGTETQFKKGAFADIHESADINRSIDLTGRAYYGNEFDNAPNHKIYQHIKKLNAMRKAIPALQGGDYRWDGNGGGNGVGYVRTKGNSIVAVGLAKDGDVTFNFSGLQNGNYVDAVTGRSIQVNNGHLTFSVRSNSAGLYVLNGPGMIGDNGAGFFEPGQGGVTKPIAILSPSPKNYLNPIALNITPQLGTGAPYNIYYTIDGSIPNTSSMVFTSPINISEDTTIKVLVIDKDGNKSLVGTYNYTIGEIEGLTVYMKKPSEWNTAHVHYWDESPNVLSESNWPGPIMTDEGDDWYAYTFQDVTSTNLLFSQNGVNKTIDMYRDKDGWYVDGVWHDVDPREPVDLPPTISISIPGGSFTEGELLDVVLTATDDNDDSPIIYYTLDGTTPDVNATIYSAPLAISETTTLRVIAYDDQSQGAIVETYTYNFKPPTNGLSVHFKPNAYENPTIYYWNTTPNGITTSWPGTVMTAEGDGWYIYTFEDEDCANFIFSNQGVSQSPDLNSCSEGWYENGIWYNTKPSHDNGLTVHFKKPLNWNSAYIHYWNTSPTTTATTWPGLQMKAEGNDWYSYTIEGVLSANIVFNDNGSQQTIDLFRDIEGWYNHGWEDVLPVNKFSQSKTKTNFKLYQNYPNPFNGYTMFAFDLPKKQQVEITILNTLGQVVDAIKSQTYSSGKHKTIYKSNLPSGIYFYKLETEEFSNSKRMIVK